MLCSLLSTQKLLIRQFVTVDLMISISSITEISFENTYRLVCIMFYTVILLKNCLLVPNFCKYRFYCKYLNIYDNENIWKENYFQSLKIWDVFVKTDLKRCYIKKQVLLVFVDELIFCWQTTIEHCLPQW